MNKFKDFLEEGKKIQIKRKYTENHPASTVGKTANVRNEILKAVKDGILTEEEFTKILSKVSKSPNRWRSSNSKYFFVSEDGVKLSKWGLRILSELDTPTLKAFPISEAIKITKDDWPIIKFKDGSKKYEVEFDDYDVIDDHGNEGKDVYFMGTDQDGKEWTIDASVGYNFDNSGNIDDIYYDTLTRVDESVTEAKEEPIVALLKLGLFASKGTGEKKLLRLSDDFEEIGDEQADEIASHLNMAIELFQDGYSKAAVPHFKKFNKACKDELALMKKQGLAESAVNEKDDAGTHLDKLAELVGKAKSFMDVGKELKAAKYKYDFGTGMMPHYQVTADGFTFMIVNKRYVDKGDREVNDIAIGLLENIKTQTTNMENIFLHESFSDFVGASGFLNEKIGSQLLASILMSNKEGKYGKENLKSLAGGFYGLAKVALDKVGDEDMVISNDPTKVFKEHGGSKHILFFISDNEKDNPYCPYDAGYGSLKTVPGGGLLIAAMSGDREFYTNDWSRYSRTKSFKKDGKKGSDDQVGVSHKYRGWSGTGLNNGKRIAEVSDRVLVINLDLIRQKYSTDQLRAARAEAKSGAIAFTNDKDFKKANNDRYHQILATKAATMPLDKMVADAIDMLTDQIKAGLASGEKTRYEEIKIGQSAKGKEVKLRDASNHMSNILDDYSRYCDYVRQEEESEKRFGSSESWYKKEIKNYALSLKEKIAKIEGFDYAW